MSGSWRRLDEVCAITMGQAPPGESYNNDGDGWPLIAGAGDFSGDLPSVKKFTTAPSKLCSRGDVILGIRASIGAKVWADARYCLGRGVAGLRPNPDLHDRFLWHWLGQNAPALAAKGRGATFLQVNRTDIGEMPIHLPSLEEQRRIADVLDGAQDLCRKRRQALAHCDNLIRSVFLDMFGDPLTNPRGLPLRPLGDWGSVITGNTPPRADSANYGHDIEWIKSDNLGSKSIFATRATESLSEGGKEKARVARSGSILVTCIAGSPNSIGNSAIVDREVAFNQQINALTPGRADPFFLLAQLRVGKRLVQDKSTGGMKGLVSKSSFASIRLLDPPLADQAKFAAVMRIVIEAADRQRAQLGFMDELLGALQSVTFAGRLGPPLREVAV